MVFLFVPSQESLGEQAGFFLLLRFTGVEVVAMNRIFHPMFVKTGDNEIPMRREVLNDD